MNLRNRKINKYNIEKEVMQAEHEEQGLIKQMNGNLHAGEKVIKKDPNPKNQNG